MKKIIICVGSSCHIKGAYEIVEILKKIINEERLETEIELGASFCQGKCTEGVVLKFDQEIVTKVSPENIRELFYREFNRGVN
jgi:NADH:ubiquinone oxidoreductase subunit E